MNSSQLVTRPVKFGGNRLINVLLLAGCIAALTICIWFFGHQQLGGFDQGLIVDTGWRMLNGQKPYEDFVLTTPPGFYLGTMLAFHLWGAKWSAVVILTIVFSITTFLLHTALLRRLMALRLGMGLALVCQILSIVVASYWWYNTIAMIGVCLFVTSALVYAKSPQSWASRLGFYVGFTIVLFMKPNMAGSAIVIALAIFLLQKSYRRPVLVISSLSLLTVCLILLLLGIDPRHVLSSYIDVARSRGLPLFQLFLQDKPQEAVISLPLITLCLLPFVVIFRQACRQFSGKWAPFWQSKDSVLYLLPLSGLFSGALGFVTNGESALVGLSPIFISGLAGMLALRQHNTLEAEEKWKLVGASVGSVAAIGVGLILRYRLLEQSGLGLRVRYLFFMPDNALAAFLWMGSLAIAVLCVVSILIRYPRRQINFRRFARLARVKPLVGRMGLSTLAWIVVLICGSIGLYAGAMRWRVMYIGPFYADEPLVTLPEMRFFDDFYVSHQAENVVRQISQALQEKSQRANPAVFFGPRMEFAYPALGIQSPRHLPIWWHPGISFAASETEEMVNRFIAYRFDLCIFLRDTASHIPDLTYLPARLIQELGYSYDRFDYNNIVVFERRVKL